MIINILGIRYDIIEDVPDSFEQDIQGQIVYKEAKILLASGLQEDVKAVALCHEIAHGMLSGIGRNDLAEDETFVQSLASAINISFTPKIADEEEINGKRT